MLSRHKTVKICINWGKKRRENIKIRCRSQVVHRATVSLGKFQFGSYKNCWWRQFITTCYLLKKRHSQVLKTPNVLDHLYPKDPNGSLILALFKELILVRELIKKLTLFLPPLQVSYLRFLKKNIKHFLLKKK